MPVVHENQLDPCSNALVNDDKCEDAAVTCSGERQVMHHWCQIHAMNITKER